MIIIGNLSFAQTLATDKKATPEKKAQSVTPKPILQKNSGTPAVNSKPKANTNVQRPDWAKYKTSEPLRDLPNEIMVAFKQKFPNITSSNWKAGKSGRYISSFSNSGVTTSAMFDKSGKWLETETEIKPADVPAGVQNSLSTDFAGYETTKIKKIETVDKGESYNILITNGKSTIEARYGADGKLINKDAYNLKKQASK